MYPRNYHAWQHRLLAFNLLEEAATTTQANTGPVSTIKQHVDDIYEEFVRVM